MRLLAYILSLVFIFSIPWEDALTVRELGTLSRVVGMIMASVWLLSVVMSGTLRRPQLFHIFILLFFIWNLASFYWTIGMDESIQRNKTYCQLILFSFIIWDLYSTQEAFKPALQSYVLGAYVSIGSTIYNLISGQTISGYSVARYTGANLNANSLALVLTIGIPIAWHLAVTSGIRGRELWLSIINYGYVPLAFFSVFLSGSRMAVLAIIPAFIYVAGTFRQIKPLKRLFIILVFTGMIIYLYGFIPQSTLIRLKTVDDSILAFDLGGRVPIWKESMQVFIEHPFLGIGSGAIRKIPEIGTVAHNSFLSVLSELGIIGLTIFSAVLTIALIKIVKMPKSRSWLWFTVFIIWGIGASTLSWEFKKSTWLLLCLVIASAGLVDKESQGNGYLLHTLV